MSDNKFFNINNSIFNREKVIAIRQQTAKIEFTVNVAVVTVMEGGESREYEIYLPPDKKVSDYVDENKLNSLD